MEPQEQQRILRNKVSGREKKEENQKENAISPGL